MYASKLAILAMAALAPVFGLRPASAQPVVDTFGPGDTAGAGSGILITDSFGVTSFADVRFTPALSGTVQFVTIALQSAIPPNTVSSGVSILISADASGAPGAALETIPVPTTVIGQSPVVITVPSVSHPALIAGQAYWVGLRPNGAFYNAWSPGAAASLGSPTWRRCSVPITGCQAGNGAPPAVRVVVESPGACCAHDFSCVVMSHAQCDSFGGTFRGAASTCNDPCPLILGLGACCSGATCALANALGCAIGGGRFLGEGVACATITGANSCCPADFNNSGTPTIADIFAFLAVWFRPCP